MESNRKSIVMVNHDSCFKRDHVCVMVFTKDAIYVRGLIEESKKDESMSFDVLVPKQELTLAQLKTPKQYFKDTCYMNSMNYYTCKLNDVSYLLVYDSFITKHDLWMCNAWHPHCNCYIKMPTFKRLLNTSSAKALFEDISGFSAFKETTVTKCHEHFYTSVSRRQTKFDKILEFIVLHDDDDFINASKIIHINNTDNFITNLTNYEVVDKFDSKCYHRDTRESFKELYPSYELIGPDTIPAGECVEFTIKEKLGDSYYPDNCSLHLEMVDGYAPHRRITISNGVGKFKVRALDLQPDDLLRFKINDNGYTSVIEKVLNVV